MEFHTIDHWDEALWLKAEPVYYQAFPEHGRKKRAIIMRMFERKICRLHLGMERSEVVAMALTGEAREVNALLIDYLAVREDHRKGGVGRQLMDYLKQRALHEEQLDGIIIEVEAETTPANLGRIRFWEKCGFTLTDYVHHYTQVPEPYRAMYLNLRPDKELPKDGAALFRCITQFHRKAYSRG